MDCIDIVLKYLKENGYDGLFNDECGCVLDDLVPCSGEDFSTCQPGYRVPCDCGEHDYHIVDKKPEADVPADLEAALAVLIETLTPEEAANLKSIPEGEMARFHHGAGRNLRNEWGLWGDSPLKRYFVGLGIEHADDMSGIIMDSLWRRVNGKPIRLEEQVQFYKDYWAKMKGGVEGRVAVPEEYDNLDELAAAERQDEGDR
jgi:hypothetical protein